MAKDKIIYFDNASTAFPKPVKVINGMIEYFTNIGGSPGRAGHILSRKGEKIIEETRVLMCNILGIDESKKNQVIFTYNATYALNMVIKGTVEKGDHVIISSFEHNSVARPVKTLEDIGLITYSVWECDNNGLFDLNKLETLITTKTKLICLNHASNVIGVIAPVKEVSELAKKYNIKLLIDATQVAGAMLLEYGDLDIDFVCFTGHKCLLGPSGIGGFYAKNPKSLKTIIEGGSGSNSHSPFQPTSIPEKFESGTINYLGIAGLNEGLKFIIKENILEIQSYENSLVFYLLDQLKKIPEIKIYGTQDLNLKIPIISFTVAKLQANEVCHLLDSEYSIMTRGGLQCAPLIHKAIGTYPNGTLRISLGYYNNLAEIDSLITVLKKIITKYVYTK